jgi:peptidoglycan hydrolase CwlO-like protein
MNLFLQKVKGTNQQGQSLTLTPSKMTAALTKLEKKLEALNERIDSREFM